MKQAQQPESHFGTGLSDNATALWGFPGGKSISAMVKIQSGTQIAMRLMSCMRILLSGSLTQGAGLRPTA
jgi:hypothetical protein